MDNLPDKTSRMPLPLRWILGFTIFCAIIMALFIFFFRGAGLAYIFYEILLLMGLFWVVCMYPFLIWAAVDFAKRTGRNGKRWGFGAAIGLYLLVFWDQIPTYVLHKYYCATEAGAWVYKTPEQWKAENPGVAETLTWKDLSDNYRDDKKRWYVLNERFHWVSRGKPNPVFPVWRVVRTVEDVKTGEVVLKEVSVNSGYSGSDWNPRKALIGCEICHPDRKVFEKYYIEFKKLGRKKE